MTSVYLPLDHATLWGDGEDPRHKSKWYVPVRYYTSPRAGHREVQVPAACLDGKWFHPDRHDNLPALAELLS